MKPDHSQGLLVYMRNKWQRIWPCDILYVQADDMHLHLHCTNGKTYCMRYSLQGFLSDHEDLLFVQTHRSYAVKLDYVTEVEADDVWLDITKVPLSRTYRKDFLGWFVLG